MIGDIYRLLADLLSVAVLVGMVYFLVRRFIVQRPGPHLSRQHQADGQGARRAACDAIR